jgi:hypothetical protein
VQWPRSARQATADIVVREHQAGIAITALTASGGSLSLRPI